MENETPTPGNETEAAPAEGAATTPEYSPEELKQGKNKATGRNADVDLELVLDIPVDVSLRVGSTDISIKDLVSLVEGSVIALDRDAGAPMEVLVNGTLIAHGEIVVVDDQYGVRLTEVVSATERIEKLH